MATSWNKKERENKKRENKKKKAEKKLERKENTVKGKGLEDMMAYLDENGNLTSSPPDPNKRVEIDVESIEIGVPKQVEGVDDVQRGVVSFFNEEKGFGFIIGKKFDNIFVHQSASKVPLKKGMSVTFQLEKGPKGFTAVDVDKDN